MFAVLFYQHQQLWPQSQRIWQWQRRWCTWFYLLATVVPTSTRNWTAVIVRPYTLYLQPTEQPLLLPFTCTSAAVQLMTLNATEVPEGKLQHWTPQRHPQESYNTGYHGSICRTLPPPASSCLLLPPPTSSLIVVEPAIQDPRYEGIAHHPSAPGSSNYDTCGNGTSDPRDTRNDNEGTGPHRGRGTWKMKTEIHPEVAKQEKPQTCTLSPPTAN